MKLSRHLAALVLPALIVAQGDLSSTTQCRTVVGKKTLRTCPTYTTSTQATSTVKLTTTSTVTKVITKRTTATIFSTMVTTSTTSLPVETDTITETTVTQTDVTSTAPTSTTTTTLTSLETTTTTINGKFTGVQDTLPSASVVPPNPVVKRAVPAKFKFARSPQTVRDIYPRDASPANGPADAGAVAVQPCKSVVCTAITASTTTSTVVKSATDKTTTTLSSTITRYPTVTITETFQPSDASTTITETSTITNVVATETPTSTVTTSTTQTITVTEIAKATCDSTNFANAASGEGFLQVRFDNSAASDDTITYDNDITNAADCCTACAVNPACSTWFFENDKYKCRFYQNNGPSGSTCNQGEDTFEVGLSGDAGAGFTLGNGNCGAYEKTYECVTCG